MPGEAASSLLTPGGAATMLGQFAARVKAGAKHAHDTVAPGVTLKTEITQPQFEAAIAGIQYTIANAKGAGELHEKTDFKPTMTGGEVTGAIIEGVEGNTKFKTAITYAANVAGDKGTMQQMLTAENAANKPVPPTNTQVLTALEAQANTGNRVFNITKCTNADTVMNAIMLANALGMEPKIEEKAVIDALEAKYAPPKVADGLLEVAMPEDQMKELNDNPAFKETTENIRAIVNAQKPEEVIGFGAPNKPPKSH